MTVTRLARSCNLARSTRPRRSAGNYRVYSEKDLDRLRQICTYRDAGLTLADIRSILDAPGGNAAAVLRRRLTELSAGIERWREHQRAIARLLKTTDRFRRLPVVTKEKFTAILRAAGFTEEDMRRLHTEFESSAPNEHQEFLEFLHIPQEEIRSIRAWSREKS
jgi:DNA-binding transcriptional MerR regulator